MAHLASWLAGGLARDEKGPGRRRRRLAGEEGREKRERERESESER